jgi:hypothetical protein
MAQALSVSGLFSKSIHKWCLPMLDSLIIQTKPGTLVAHAYNPGYLGG